MPPTSAEPGPVGILIRPIQTGQVRLRPAHLAPPGDSRLERTVFGRRLAILRDRDWTVPLPVLTFLVEHPEGRFPSTPATPEELLPIVDVLPLQILARRLALARGLDPDRPRGLSKITQTW